MWVKTLMVCMHIEGRSQSARARLGALDASSVPDQRNIDPTQGESDTGLNPREQSSNTTVVGGVTVLRMDMGCEERSEEREDGPRYERVRDKRAASDVYSPQGHLL